MLGKSAEKDELELFRSRLDNMINMRHELVLLAHAIDWSYFEQDFAPLYSQRGAKSKPIRLMVGCLLLKPLYNLSDENWVKNWVENPYMQYFCGETYFQQRRPFTPSELVHFRNRLGKSGIEKIFVASIKMHGKDAEEKQVVSDTTVQGNFITFPTDAKQYYRIIKYCNKISKEAGVKQRQSYLHVGKDLLQATHNAKHPKRAKRAQAAYRHLRVIAGRLLRELDRRLNAEIKEKYKELLSNCKKVYEQEKDSKDKIYSLHKPYTSCIAKGKVDKQYEFGGKVGIVATAKSEIIVAALSFQGNPHDSSLVSSREEEWNTFSQRDGLRQRGARSKGC